MRLTILTLAALVGSGFAAAGAAGDRPHPSASGELPRRALFGARLGPVPEDTRKRQGLSGTAGVLLERVFPDSSAANAGFLAGDVVVALDGRPIRGVSDLQERLAAARGGQVLRIELARDGIRSTRAAALREMPREQGAGCEVRYGAVNSRGVRLRSLVTRPPGPGRHPAVLLLQGGHTAFSIDLPMLPPTGFTRVARGLAGSGFVTMRVDRHGCGDSEGGPLRDVDFQTELEGWRESLRELRRLDFVDPQRVFLFGHSMGGIVAPLLARETPVAGLAVFGTTAETWFESVMSQRRRLAMLEGTEPAALNGELADQTRFWYLLSVAGKTPREIERRHPEVPRRIREQWVKEGRYVADRHYRYYHQLAGLNLPDAWTRPAVPEGGTPPRVLVLWGSADWLASREQSDGICETINRIHPGRARLVEVAGTDHFFLRAASTGESYRMWKPVPGTPPGEFHPGVLEQLRNWLSQPAQPPAG